jgi:hypothetical protein
MYLVSVLESLFFAVIPAKAGIQCAQKTFKMWIPAFAGMTIRPHSVNPEQILLMDFSIKMAKAIIMKSTEVLIKIPYHRRITKEPGNA